MYGMFDDPRSEEIYKVSTVYLSTRFHLLPVEGSQFDNLRLLEEWNGQVVGVFTTSLNTAYV